MSHEMDLKLLQDHFRSEALRLIERYGEFVVGISFSDRTTAGKICYFLKQGVTETQEIGNIFKHLLAESEKKDVWWTGKSYFVASQEKIDSLKGTLYEKFIY